MSHGKDKKVRTMKQEWVGEKERERERETKASHSLQMGAMEREWRTIGYWVGANPTSVDWLNG